MDIKNIAKKWHIGNVLDFKKISSGIFNESYFVYVNAVGSVGGGAKKEKMYVLQKLHSLIATPGPTLNYVAVTQYLGNKGLVAQKVLRAKNKKYLVRVGKGVHKGVWRMIEPVPGIVYDVIKSPSFAREAGKVLGETHLALMGFKKRFKKTLPMFQYKAVLLHLKKNAQTILTTSASPVGARDVAQFLLENFPKYFLPDNLPKRLIHTDPKISNFVFDSRGAGLAMIDWDTVQYLSPLYDIGDALRSICGGLEDDPNNTFNTPAAKEFLKGYFETSGKYLSSTEKKLIPQAAGLITLGLSARFLNDYVEDFYFGWDATKYKSRKEHNLARTIGMVALFKSFKNTSF